MKQCRIKEEYDNRRYHYSEYDKSRIWVKPPREVLIEEIKDNK